MNRRQSPVFSPLSKSHTSHSHPLPLQLLLHQLMTVSLTEKKRKKKENSSIIFPISHARSLFFHAAQIELWPGVSMTRRKGPPFSATVWHSDTVHGLAHLVFHRIKTKWNMEFCWHEIRWENFLSFFFSSSWLEPSKWSLDYWKCVSIWISSETMWLRNEEGNVSVTDNRPTEIWH